MTGTQAREARRLLGWSMRRLGVVCGLSQDVVSTFEATSQVRRSMFPTDRLDRIARLQAVLEAAGVEFTDGDAPGVKLRNLNP